MYIRWIARAKILEAVVLKFKVVTINSHGFMQIDHQQL